MVQYLYKIWFIYFFIALIVLVLYIIKYLIKKDKKDLGKATIVFLEPLFMLLKKVVYLDYFVFFKEDSTTNHFMIAGLILGVIGVILFLVLGKNSEETKKNVVGASFAIFAMVFVFLGLTPLMTFQAANYAFDESELDVVKAVVVDKEVDHVGRGGPRYYLEIQIGSTQYDIRVIRNTYEEYDIEDVIYLEYYAGYFGKEYYRIRE